MMLVFALIGIGVVIGAVAAGALVCYWLIALSLGAAYMVIGLVIEARTARSMPIMPLIAAFVVAGASVLVMMLDAAYMVALGG